jgi:hypothetical protein
MNERQRKYLQAMTNYKPFQKFIMPKTRKIHQKTSYSFESLANSLNRECGNITFINVASESGYMVCCARMDLQMDLIFVCIVLKPDTSLQDIFEDKIMISLQEIEMGKLKKLKELKIVVCKYFYFSCGCDSMTSFDKDDDLSDSGT